MLDVKEAHANLALCVGLITLFMLSLQPSTTLHDGTPSSQLSFVGAERVHSLYDFLLNDAQTPLAGSMGSQQPDVPVLLSPTHFTGGVAWRPQIKVGGQGFDLHLQLYRTLVPKCNSPVSCGSP